MGIFIAGCVPSKPAYEERELPVDRVLKKIEANRRKVKTFVGNGVINISSPELDAKATFEIEIKKPDSIKLSVFGPFGIDLAQAVVTNNTFEFYDVLKNRVYRGTKDQDILKRVFKVDMSFNNLMDAFAGAVNLTDKLSSIPSDYSVNSDAYKLIYKDKDSEETIFTIEVNDLTITDYEFYRRNNLVLSGNYRSFRTVDDLLVPFKIFIKNNSMDQILDVDYRKIKLNISIDNMNLTYPSDAEIINWN